MSTNAKVMDICLASTDGKEFEANALAMAMGDFCDVAELAEAGPLEARGFVDLLKVNIAQLKAKIAVHEAALVRVEKALEPVLHSTAKN